MNSDNFLKTQRPNTFVRVGETPTPASSQVPGLIVGFAIGTLGMLAILPFLATRR